jgi:hypothetical protein
MLQATVTIPVGDLDGWEGAAVLNDLATAMGYGDGFLPTMCARLLTQLFSEEDWADGRNYVPSLLCRAIFENEDDADRLVESLRRIIAQWDELRSAREGE